jgi:hypothetical protein
MKKYILLLAMVISVCIAQAQTHKSKFGFRAGLSSSGYYGSDAKTYHPYYPNYGGTNKLAFTGGFYVNSMVSDFFWIKTEFYFSNKGMTVNFDSADVHKKLNFNAYYIECMPILPAIHFKGFQLFAGPSVGFAVSSNYKVYNAGSNKVETKVDTEMDNYNRLDLGILAGFEYEAPFGLNVGIRKTTGLSSIIETPSGGTKKNWYNNVWMFTVGYTIGKNAN